MMRISFLLILCMAAAASPGARAGSGVDVQAGLLVAHDPAACGHDGRECSLVVEQPSLSLLQSHAVGLLAKSDAAQAARSQSAAVGAAKREAADARAVQAGNATRNETQAKPSGAADGQVSTSTAVLWAVGAVALLMAAGLLSLGKAEDDTPALAKCVAEFVGTFMLVFSVGCNVLVGDATWGVVSIACTLMVSIYALGGVSGGNFNPAVSIALGLSQKMGASDVAMYICTQLAAGILASLSYGLMLGKTFDLGPADGYSGMQAGLAELLYTFMLCFCVLNTAASKKHAGKDQFYGLTIGFSVIAGGYGAGSISGGCFNPAVALGIDASSSGLGFGWCLPYFAFEILGAALAAALFRACRPDDFHEELADQPYALGGRLLSEFLGTYMLILTVGLNVLAGSKAAVFSIAASLMCMIFSLGSVSGAHFNPAVTAAVLLSGRGLIAGAEALAYVCAQVAGGVAAAFTYVLLENGQTVELKPSASVAQALLGELAFTFLLSFVVLSVATIQSPLSQYFGLAIGSCVTAGGLAIGSLSGGSLNPAVSAGLAISSGSLAHLPSYAAVELLGGAAAAVVFRATRPGEYAKAA